MRSELLLRATHNPNPAPKLIIISKYDTFSSGSQEKISGSVEALFALLSCHHCVHAENVWFAYKSKFSEEMPFQDWSLLWH